MQSVNLRFEGVSEKCFPDILQRAEMKNLLRLLFCMVSVLGINFVAARYIGDQDQRDMRSEDIVSGTDFLTLFEKTVAQFNETYQNITSDSYKPNDGIDLLNLPINETISVLQRNENKSFNNSAIKIKVITEHLNKTGQEAKDDTQKAKYGKMHPTKTDGEIISVSITSSVAIGRGKSEKNEAAASRDTTAPEEMSEDERNSYQTPIDSFTPTESSTYEDYYLTAASDKYSVTVTPPRISGANEEYIKQQKEKEELKKAEFVHPYQKIIAQKSVQADRQDADDVKQAESIESAVIEEHIPIGRSISNHRHSNTFQEEGTEMKGAHVTNKKDLANSHSHSHSYSIVHDVPHLPHVYSSPAKIYSEPSKIYSEPAKVYSKPEIFYSEPAKVYSEPAKIYSEPAKVYSEPAKIYSEPAKIYGTPSKVYSQPASLYLDNEPNTGHVKVTDTNRHQETTTEYNVQSVADQLGVPSTEPSKIGASFSMDRYKTDNHTPPEQNYEVDEAVSVMSNGRVHGVQEKNSTDHQKVGYVVEGRNYRKYRLEERTPDGFIVGEYGVVSHDDGMLRGVRYTADGTTNPRLIHDALQKFLSLK